MRRHLSRFAVLLAVIVLPATAVRADPIPVTVTSGTIDVTSPVLATGRLSLFGTDGFSFISGLREGGFTPGGCCLEPGQTRTISGTWSGSSLGGTITYKGETFTDIGGFNSPNAGQVSVTSSPFVAPPATAGGVTTTITAPFTLTGSFGSPNPRINASFTGSGIGSLSLVSTFTGSSNVPFAWVTRAAHLDIMAPTPEPTSLLLLGLGVAGVWFVQRRHERAAA